jgi:hypothetical protein
VSRSYCLQQLTAILQVVGTSAIHLQDDALAEACQRAEHAYLRAADESVVSADALLATYPESLPGHLLRIGKLVAAKDAAELPALRRALAQCAPLEGGADDRQRALLAAARAWLAARPRQAAEIYTRVVREAPQDLLALRLAQSCWYFLGERGQMRAVVERASAHWTGGMPGHDIALALHAFACAESADGARAEELALAALAIEPRSPHSIHALAHALAMQDRPAAGVRVLRDGASCWRAGGRMDSHIAWHLAVLELETGSPAAALSVFDRDLTAPAALGTGGGADATDLLWRLELAGVEVGARWQDLSDAWARHLQPGFWGFLDVLAGLAFLRAGHRWRALWLKQAIAAAPRNVAHAHPSPGAVTLSALAAIDAFVGRAYECACAALRGSLPHLGGSLPQRDLLGLTLAVARSRAAAAATALPAAA